MILQSGTVVGTVTIGPAGGPWTRILLSNRDGTQAFNYKINGNGPLVLDPLGNYGDNYANEPITQVDLVNTGGTPAYQITLHS